jgi:hypothetical protein
MRSAALLQFWSILLNPAVDRRMIDRQSPFQHDFFEISVTERIAQIPAYAQKDDVSLKMTPFERLLLGHVWSSLALFSQI